jgi:hypothetical protein
MAWKVSRRLSLQNKLWVTEKTGLPTRLRQSISVSTEEKSS